MLLLKPVCPSERKEAEIALFWTYRILQILQLTCKSSFFFSFRGIKKFFSKDFYLRSKKIIDKEITNG